MKISKLFKFNCWRRSNLTKTFIINWHAFKLKINVEFEAGAIHQMREGGRQSSQSGPSYSTKKILFVVNFRNSETIGSQCGPLKKHGTHESITGCNDLYD